MSKSRDTSFPKTARLNRSLRASLGVAMREPDSFVLQIVYQDGEGKKTLRYISPTKEVSGGRIQAMCMIDGQLKYFIQNRIRRWQLIDANQVSVGEPRIELDLAPEPGED
ncbi:MAG: hypothetical protein AAF394_02495 [Planctomycetota bacterium]